MTGSRSAVTFALLLLLPAVVYIHFIVAYPLVETFDLSFTDAALKPITNWVGWKNYQKIFNGRFPPTPRSTGASRHCRSDRMRRDRGRC